MRGTPEAERLRSLIGGIIPAHAGNTLGECPVLLIRRDHPRACGEHPLLSTTTFSELGSSPRMRGTHARRLQFAQYIGIIPAHAGNTYIHGSRFSHRRDHPRACGEHDVGSRSSVMLQGSSPRMRGTRSSDSAQPLRVGIIPAHAGNTASSSETFHPDRDHPRACGEHTSRLAQYRGFLIRSVCFLFSFILSTSLLAGIYWRCSIRDEEHRQKTLPSHWMAV